MLGQREREREGESRYKESYLKAERGELRSGGARIVGIYRLRAFTDNYPSGSVQVTPVVVYRFWYSESKRA